MSANPPLADHAGAARVAAEPSLVNASRFRAAHEIDWKRLDGIVSRIERRGIGALTESDLLMLPLLYRSALSSLSVARETSLDRALVAYLEDLCTRAYFQVYGVPTSFWSQLVDFFARGWPLTVQALWRETLVAALLTVAGALTAFLLVLHDPGIYYAIMPDALTDGRNPAASADTLRATLYASGGQDGLAVFATALFTHNAQLAIFAFALGFAFAIPTVLLILYNGLMLGAFLALFASKGLLVPAGGWLMIHGTTEIFAIILSGAAGFRIGTAIAFPGRAARTDFAFAVGRRASVAMAGAVVMLILAGILEGDRAADGHRRFHPVPDRPRDAGRLADLFLRGAEGRWPGRFVSATIRRTGHRARCGAASSRPRGSICGSN